MPLSDADYATLLRLNYKTCALKLELCFLKMKLASKAGFNPNQPRLPRGNPDGGQWTRVGGGRTSSAGRFGRHVPAGQTQLISSRPRGSGTVRIGGQWVAATPAQQARLAVSQARAQAVFRRVREIDPNWRPTPSLYESVEGAILANESVVREAEARLAEFNALPASRSSETLFLPGGRDLGIRNRGAGKDVRTVERNEFSELFDGLLRGSKSTPSRPDYEGQWFERPDGLVFGVRISARHGLTIEIIRSSNPLLPQGYKVHAK